MADDMDRVNPGRIGSEIDSPHLNDRVVTPAVVLRERLPYLHGREVEPWEWGGALSFERGFESSFSIFVGGANPTLDMRELLFPDDPVPIRFGPINRSKQKT